MRTIALAALVVALATPAWAFNDDERQAAYNVCRDVGTSEDICNMKHARTEADAIARAKQRLELCKSDDPKDYIGGSAATCLGDRAYIKQRWGY